MGWNSWCRLFSSAPRLVGGNAKKLKVFVVAGEPSGDAIGGHLMAALKNLSPNPVQFAGVGGASMQKEGLQSQFDMEELSVMGIVELFPHLLKFRRRLKETIKAAGDFEPNVIVTIDSKGFCFRLLQGVQDACDKSGCKRPLTVHYVAPSFWAWKGGEEALGKLSSFVDHVLCILPFEEEVCRAHGVEATFVGHPVLEDAYESNTSIDVDPSTNKWFVRGNGAKFRLDHDLPLETTMISVLPGSRLQEVKRMLPIFEGALGILRKAYPEITAVIPTVPSVRVTKTVEDAVASWDVPAILLPGASQQQKYDAFAASQAGLCTSGTAVLQMQMARLPAVVAYRTNIITEQVIRSRAKVRYISLPNIMLDSPVLPEALFSGCSPKNLVHFLSEAITSVGFRETQREAADRLLPMLAPLERKGWCRPSTAAARAVLDQLRKQGDELGSPPSTVRVCETAVK